MTLNYMVCIKKERCSIPNCLNQAKIWYNVKHKKKYIKESEDLKMFGVGQIDLYNKRIAVCAKHYFQIGSGQYGGSSLKKLPGYIM
jgi:hypothetical protein